MIISVVTFSGCNKHSLRPAKAINCLLTTWRYVLTPSMYNFTCGLIKDNGVVKEHVLRQEQFKAKTEK